MAVTRELVGRWVEGWCDSRQMHGRRDGEGWLVDVDAATRSREYVSLAPSPVELRRLLAAATTPEVWLTIVGDIDAASAEVLAGLDALTSGEHMMTAPVAPGPVPAQVRIEERGRVAFARIEVEGELAAQGQAAVRAGDVVFDRIETIPAFRRRGFGGLVMTGLSVWAADQGATTGLLMASVGGRRLYGSLGWSDVAPIRTFRGWRGRRTSPLS